MLEPIAPPPMMTVRAVVGTSAVCMLRNCSNDCGANYFLLSLLRVVCCTLNLKLLVLQRTRNIVLYWAISWHLPHTQQSDRLG